MGPDLKYKRKETANRSGLRFLIPERVDNEPTLNKNSFSYHATDCGFMTFDEAAKLYNARIPTEDYNFANYLLELQLFRQGEESRDAMHDVQKTISAPPSPPLVLRVNIPEHKEESVPIGVSDMILAQVNKPGVSDEIDYVLHHPQPDYEELFDYEPTLLDRFSAECQRPPSETLFPPDLDRRTYEEARTLHIGIPVFLIIRLLNKHHTRQHGDAHHTR